jgi:spore coat protein H
MIAPTFPRLGLIFLFLFAVAAVRAQPPAPRTPADLFQSDQIWSIHLRFTSEQWTAMEPTAGGRPVGFNFAAMFAPSMAQAFIKEGDQNGDGALSKEEFTALSEKWFTAWDKQKRGALGFNELREGLSAVTAPVNGPPRMSLQGGEGKRNGVGALMGIEFKYVHADIEFQGQTLKDVGVRFKGNGTFLESRSSLKRSLKINLNHYVKGQKFAGVTTLDLQNNVTDPSEMNEVLAYRLYHDAGVAAPRTSYARVFVTVPGKHDHQYFGLYSLSENVDKEFIRANFGNVVGAIFKPVTPDLFGDMGDDWKVYLQTYDPKTAVTDAQSARVIEMCKLLTNSSDADFAGKIANFIDLEQFARYLAVTVWVSDLDGILGPGQNFYLHLNPTTNHFTFIPWDQDHSFGRLRGTQEQREKLSINKPWQGENRFLERMFKVDAFQKQYQSKLAEFSKTIFKPERFHKQVDDLTPLLRPAVAEQSDNRAAAFDLAVSGKVEAGGFLSFLTGPPDREKPIKGFVDARAPSVLEQLAGKSKGLTLDGFGSRNRGQPGGFRPGMLFAAPFSTALDNDHDGSVSHAEFVGGFGRWFDAWAGKGNMPLTLAQIKDGINRDLGRRAAPTSKAAAMDAPAAVRRGAE